MLNLARQADAARSGSTLRSRRAAEPSGERLVTAADGLIVRGGVPFTSEDGSGSAVIIPTTESDGPADGAVPGSGGVGRF